jgi:hypothetical protein
MFMNLCHPGYITQWGSTGSGLGQLNSPQGIAVDFSGNVYVADTGNNRVQKFGSVSTISVEQVVPFIVIAVIVGSMGAYLTMRRHPKNLRRTIFNRVVTKFERNRFLFLASAVVFVFAATSIFWNFQRMGLSHWDEYYYVGTAAWAMNINWGRFQTVEPTLFPFLLSIMFRIFGLYDYVAVATSEVMAILLCVLTFWWTQREYDGSTAIVSVLILGSTSMFILYAKMALADMTLTFFFSATIFAYAYALKKRSNWAFLVAGMLLALTMSVKYNGFLPLAVSNNCDVQ